MNAMGTMGIQQRTTWCFNERLKYLSEMESCSGSWPKNGVDKRISKAHSHWKEIKKASEPLNRDIETRLQEEASIKIEKRSRGMPGKSRGLIRIRRL